MSAAQLPRSKDQDPHRLDVDKDSCKQSPQSWRVDLEAGTPSALFAPPVDKLCEVHHHRHHQSNLETMEKIHKSRACTTVHERSADVQKCSDNHGPTSGTDDGGERQAQHADCTDELARCHWLQVLISIATSTAG